MRFLALVRDHDVGLRRILGDEFHIDLPIVDRLKEIDRRIIGVVLAIARLGFRRRFGGCRDIGQCRQDRCHDEKRDRPPAVRGALTLDGHANTFSRGSLVP